MSLKTTLGWRLLFSEDNRTTSSPKSTLVQPNPDWEQFKSYSNTAKLATGQVLVQLNSENTETLSFVVVVVVVVELDCKLKSSSFKQKNSKHLCFLSTRTAMWKQNSAGLHSRTVFKNRLPGSLPATRARLLLHVDPCCGIYTRWAGRNSYNHPGPSRYLTIPFSTKSRTGTVQIPVPVRWGELPSEPWDSVCGWDSLRVRRAISIWLHSCLFERHVSGSQKESDAECQVTAITSHLLRSAAFLSSAVWLWRHTGLWGSQGCVWCVWGKWIVLPVDIRILHCRSSQRYPNVLCCSSHVITQNKCKLLCITSNTLY